MIVGKTIAELLEIYKVSWGKKAKFTVCPPGEGEPPDPGWENHKPRERLGFKELDEYRDCNPEDKPGKG